LFKIKLNLRTILVVINTAYGFELIAIDKCIFCDREYETLIHLFCTCSLSKSLFFWNCNKLLDWIKTKNNGEEEGILPLWQMWRYI